jgi:hypothetical protein
VKNSKIPWKKAKKEHGKYFNRKRQEDVRKEI